MNFSSVGFSTHVKYAKNGTRTVMKKKEEKLEPTRVDNRYRVACLKYEFKQTFVVLSLQIFFLQTWLKPGGTLFITDYCRGDQKHSQEFLDYVQSRG